MGERNTDAVIGIPKISIVILTYNGSKYISSLLDAVFSQECKSRFEVIIIDSSSTDDTCRIARSYNVYIHVIDQLSFSHPGTRNLGLSLSKGQFIVFITQDAWPINSSWLDELVNPVERYPQIAASYSRQIPRPECNPLEARDIYIGAPCIDEIRYANMAVEWQKNDYLRNMHRYISFSNVSACYRSDLLGTNPFDERLKMVEDQEWAKRMIESGYAIHYASKSIIMHSHNHTIDKISERFFDYGRSFKKFMPYDPPARSSILKSSLYEWINDIFFISGDNRRMRSKLKWMCLSPFRRFAAKYGMYKGWKNG